MGRTSDSLAAGAGLGAGLGLIMYWVYDSAPLALVLGIALAAMLLFSIVKFPVVSLVLLSFVPHFKQEPSLHFLQSQVDLTVLFLILVVCVCVFRLLVDIAQANGRSVRWLFAGQGSGVGAFCLFAGIVAVSYLYSPASDYGWLLLSRFWAIGGVLFLAPLLLVREERDFRHFTLTFVGFGLVLATQLVIALLVRNPNSAEDITRIGAGWDVGVAILLLIYYPVFVCLTRQRLLVLVCLPWLVAGLVASASRGAVISVAVALLATSVGVLRKRSLRFTVVMCVVIVVSTVVSFRYLEHADEMKYKTKITEMVELSKGTQTEGSGGLRVKFFKAALRAIAERPVFGLGVGGWSVYYLGRDLFGEERVDPHNIFLQIAVEQGLLGLAAFVVFLGTAAFAVKRIFAAAGMRFVVLFSVLVFMLSASLVSGNLDDDRGLWLWASMAFAVHRMTRREATNPEHGVV